MKKPTRKSKRSDPQATVAPDDLEEYIRRRAYELWEQSGREHGADKAHWLRAEQEVIQTIKIINT